MIDLTFGECGGGGLIDLREEGRARGRGERVAGRGAKSLVCVRAARFSILYFLQLIFEQKPPLFFFSVNSLYDSIRMHPSESERGFAAVNFFFLLLFCGV